MDMTTEQDELLEALSNAVDVAAFAYVKAIRGAAGQSIVAPGAYPTSSTYLERYAEGLRETGMTRNTVNNISCIFWRF